VCVRERERKREISFEKVKNKYSSSEKSNADAVKRYQFNEILF